MPIREQMARRALLGLASVALAAAALTPSAWAEGDKTPDKPLLVFAAASLKNAMDGVASAYDSDHEGADVKVSYAGSSTLARQIESGAPARRVCVGQSAMDGPAAARRAIDESSL